MSKPVLCLDFDGVCHSYTSGWQGAEMVSDPPVKELFEFLLKAQAEFEVHIFSSRSHQAGGIEAMQTWFQKHEAEWWGLDLEANEDGNPILPIYKDLQFPAGKPPAFLTIDDRAWRFTGQFPDIHDLRAFEPWWRR